MKVRRTAMEEVGRGVFKCAIEVDAASMADFLALFPEAGKVFDVPLEHSGSAAPPAPELPVIPNDAPAPRKEDTQIIAPTGLDIARVSGGRALPREVLVWMVMIRDPIFQEWTVVQSKVAHSAIPDIVDFAAEYVAKQAGAPSLFEIGPDHFPALAALQERYETHMRTRGLAPAGAPT